MVTTGLGIVINASKQSLLRGRYVCFDCGLEVPGDLLVSTGRTSHSWQRRRGVALLAVYLGRKCNLPILVARSRKDQVLVRRPSHTFGRLCLGSAHPLLGVTANVSLLAN